MLIMCHSSTTQLADARSQSRTPLLLVGGWCMARSDWGEEFTRRLASRRPVVTFDSRGVGQSDCPDGPYSVNMLANDCLSVLRYTIMARIEIVVWFYVRFYATLQGMHAAQHHQLDNHAHPPDVLDCSFCRMRLV